MSQVQLLIQSIIPKNEETQIPFHMVAHAKQMLGLIADYVEICSQESKELADASRMLRRTPIPRVT